MDGHAVQAGARRTTRSCDCRYWARGAGWRVTMNGQGLGGDLGQGRRWQDDVHGGPRAWRWRRAAQKVVIVDFDVGLRNLDLVMGAERRVVFDLINVVQGDAKLVAGADPRQARGDAVAAGGLADPGQGRADAPRGWSASSASCARSSTGWSATARPASRRARHPGDAVTRTLALVVTNPEVSSVRDSDRIIGLLDSKTAKAERGERMEKHLLLTRYDPGAGGARRHAEDRGRAGNPVDSRC